jgi:hypothetical protein
MRLLIPTASTAQPSKHFDVLLPIYFSKFILGSIYLEPLVYI